MIDQELSTIYTKHLKCPVGSLVVEIHLNDIDHRQLAN